MLSAFRRWLQRGRMEEEEHRGVVLVCSICGFLFAVLGPLSFWVLWAVNWRPWRLYRYANNWEYVFLWWVYAYICSICMFLSWDSLITCYITLFVVDSIVSNWVHMHLVFYNWMSSLPQYTTSSHSLYLYTNWTPTKFPLCFWQYSSSCFVPDISQISISILMIFRQQIR
jgi:hypothetical protein